MGCKQCSNHTQSNEVVTNPPENPKEVFPKAQKSTIQNDIHIKLSELGFKKYSFLKITEYEIQFDFYSRRWMSKQSKVIKSKGILQPILVNQLQLANQYIKESIESQNLDTPRIQLDPQMILKCALTPQSEFPPLNLMLLGNQDLENVKYEGQYTIIRSWNLSEQMINFETIPELIKELKDHQPQENFKLIGICRGTTQQKEGYETLIKLNGWNQYEHIFINQENQEGEVFDCFILLYLKGYIFDIHFDEETGEIVKGDILTAMVICPQGQVIFQEFTNEWTFSADNDEIEPKIKQAIEKYQEKQIEQIQPELNIIDISESQRQQYLKLKALLTDEILKNFSDKSFNRDILLKLHKEIEYVGGNKIRKVIKDPVCEIAGSKKTMENTQDLFNFIKNSLENYDDQGIFNHINTSPNIWNLDLLSNAIKQILQKQNLNISAIMEKKFTIQITQQEITVSFSKWEESPISPVYMNTEKINEINDWVQARESIQTELEVFKTKGNDPVCQTIYQKLQAFFNQIPSTLNVIDTNFGGIPYVIRRQPPYEELQEVQKQGQVLQRDPEATLVIYFLDYENEKSLSILMSLVEKLEYTKVQFVILAHVQAESWTRLFQAYIERTGLIPQIKEGKIQTFFPIQDKLFGLHFSTILRKIYGLQLEKKDIMIIDAENKIRCIESSRKIEQDFIQMIQSIKSIRSPLQVQRNDYKQEFNQLKKLFTKRQEIIQQCQVIQSQTQNENDMLLLEQKMRKIWDFNAEGVVVKKEYQKPLIKNRLSKQSLHQCQKLEEMIFSEINRSNMEEI